MKTFRSALCFLLVAATVLAYIPAFSVKGTAAVESPADIATIISRLETIKTGKYGVGKYFTENGKACTGGKGHSCSNCHTATAAEAGAAGCRQCFGFARYVFYQVFGKILSTVQDGHTFTNYLDNITVVGQSTTADAATWKSILSQALPGDVIKVPGHTMIVESADATGVQVLDCNWDRQCGIQSRKMTWSALTAYATKLTLYRAVNYPSNSGEIMGTPPSDMDTIVRRLETIKAGKYGVGKYFTENGKACTSHSTSNGRSTNCHMATAAEAGTAGCWQCFGFARYVFYQLFGKPLAINYYLARRYELEQLDNITVVGQSTSADAAAWKSILSQALPGDVIQRSKTPTSGQHTMIVESVDATGVQILDCNGTASLCKIDSRKMTWSDLAAKGSCFTLYRAKNYPYSTYTVRYDANGGSGTTVSSVHTYGTAKALTANGYYRDGYTFQGWSTDKNATSAAYTDKQKVLNLTSVAGGTVTLYAVWKPNTYTVQYDANGGSGATASSVHTYGTAKALTANGYYRDGYTFQGWSTDKNATSAAYTDKQKVLNLTSVAGGTVTLYAVWKPNTYTVQYDANGGSGATASSVHTYGTAKALTANGYYRDGYTFQGWSTDRNATYAPYADTQYVLNLTSTAGGTVTLYAVWMRTTITSPVYRIDTVKKTVSGFAEETTAETFLAGIDPTGLVLLQDGSAYSGRYVGTGLTVEYRIDGRTVDALTLMLAGDVNGDGRVTATDYLLMKRAVLALSDLSGPFAQAADINEDGKCTATDYLLAKRAVLGLSSL